MPASLPRESPLPVVAVVVVVTAVVATAVVATAEVALPENDWQLASEPLKEPCPDTMGGGGSDIEFSS